jgi:hypothetical protein
MKELDRVFPAGLRTIGRGLSPNRKGAARKFWPSSMGVSAVKSYFPEELIELVENVLHQRADSVAPVVSELIHKEVESLESGVIRCSG